jgi:hypothetical protein
VWKFDKEVALPALLHGSESWTIKARDINGIQSVEMGYIRTVKGCTRLGHIKNVRTELSMRTRSDVYHTHIELFPPINL